MSDPILANGTKISSIEFRLTHGGEAGIGNAWTLEFEDSAGVDYCADNSIGHEETSTYTSINITGSCPKLLDADNLTDFQITMTNGDTKGPDDAFIDFVDIFIIYETGYLNVTLNSPAVDSSTDKVQNTTFTVNATITCSGIANGSCGTPRGTLRFNDTTTSPDTNVSKKASIKAKPFYVINSTHQDAPMIFAWNRTENPGGADIGRGVAVDSNDNIVVVGQQDGADWRIMKFDENGTSLWNRTENPGGADIGRGVAVDSNDNIVVVGSQGDADTNWRIMKFDENGTSLWNVTANPGGTDIAFDVAVDSNDNIIVVGDEDPSGTDAADWRIMKFDENGTSLWNRTENLGGTDIARGVAVDSNDNIVVVGEQNATDWRIMKFDENGTSLWNRTENPGGTDKARGVAVDNSDNIIVVGEQNAADWRIMKFDQNGNSLWNVTANPEVNDVAYSVAIDSNDRVIVAGSQNEGAGDWRIMKFDGDGTSLWSETVNPGGNDIARGIAVDGSDNIIVVGEQGETPDDNWHIRKYETNRNPNQCPGLIVGEECSIVWTVNATGAIGSSYYLDVNFTTNDANILSNDTENFQINITSGVAGPDVTPPTIAYVSPSDANNTVARQFTYVNVTVTDTESNIDQCLLEWDGTNESMTLHGSGTSVFCSINKTDNDGNHTYLVYANDTENNTASSEPRHITFDTTPPEVDFVTPTPVNDTYTVNYVYVNVTATDLLSNIDQCMLEWDGVNESMTKNATSSNNTHCSVNKTSLANANYTYRVFANDTLNNTNASATRHANVVAVDTTAPTITNVTPTDPDGANVTRNFTYINVTVDDTQSSIDTCTLEWDGTNESMTVHGSGSSVFCSVNKTEILDAGLYTWRVFANDTENNTASLSLNVNFSIASIQVYETGTATDHRWTLIGVPVDFNYYCYAGVDGSCDNSKADDTDGNGTIENFTIESFGKSTAGDIDVLMYSTSNLATNFFICSSTDANDGDNADCVSPPAQGANGADHVQIYNGSVWLNISSSTLDGTAYGLAIACDLAPGNFSGLDFQIRVPNGVANTTHNASLTFAGYTDISGCTVGNYYTP